MCDLNSIVKSIVVRKDNWTPSRPWVADLIMVDGQIWKGWQSGFRTKKALMAMVDSFLPNTYVVPSTPARRWRS